MRMTIGKKLGVGFIIVLLVMIAAVISGIVGLGQVDSKMVDVSEDNWPAADAIMNVRIAFLEKGFAHSMIIEGEIDESGEMWDEADKQFTSMMEQLRETGLISESRITELERLNSDLNRHKDGLITAYLTGGTEVKDVEAMAKSEAVMNSQAMEELDGVIETMSPMFVQLGDEITAMMDDSIEAGHATMSSSRSTMLVFTIIGIALGIVISLVSTRIITNPLQKLVEAAGAVARRDLTADIESKSEDEVGQLANSFRGMVQSLRDIVKRVSTTSQGVSFSAQQLSSAAQQTNASVQEVSSAIEQVAKGAQTQAQRVQQTTSVMEDLGASISQGAQSARAAAEASAQASESARTGAESVKEAIATMDKIESVTVLTSGAVTKLGERGEQMTEIGMKGQGSAPAVGAGAPPPIPSGAVEPEPLAV